MKPYILSILLLFTFLSLGATSPFTSPPEKMEEVRSKSFMKYVMETQRKLHSKINSLFKETKKDNSALLGFLAITFLYGVFHSLGPGHRKTIIAAYASRPKTSRRETMLISSGFALLHSLSAIILVVGIIQMAKMVTGLRPGQSIQQATRFAELGSYSLIIILGIYMLWEVLSHFFTNDKKEKAPKNINFWGVLLSGLVPCPGASLILILAISQKAMWIGISGVLAMSIGMALVLGGIGFTSFTLRSIIQKQLSAKKVWADRFALLIEACSAAVVFIFGILMIFGTLSQPMGF